ncbi:Uncharacterised protein [Acholeplasma hippikon]|uniref:Uncharacterized protein n=2 Tax=Acholeplasma hippikon TaxID=264636 RepID=A0A449BIB6_9MOLU|nr:Uncharacterised protein [Acholeplasma hippikon]
MFFRKKKRVNVGMFVVKNEGDTVENELSQDVKTVQVGLSKGKLGVKTKNEKAINLKELFKEDEDDDNFFDINNMWDLYFI